jgi:uncharacterized protein (UPF0332 family)
MEKTLPLIRKSDENLQSADVLIQNKKYTSSVHCSYYSCYQMVMVLTKRPEVSYNTNETRYNSHEQTINTLITFLESVSYDTDKINSITENLRLLRKERNKADYKRHFFNEKQAKEIYICAQSTQKMLKDCLNNLDNINDNAQ